MQEGVIDVCSGLEEERAVGWVWLWPMGYRRSMTS